jgi:NAD(P)-dependent dehydrogenase (short-subunit alcohol dehydrogenase family)
MDLAGLRYVVAGGTGVAGETIVLALLRHGATVVVPSRSPERLARLREVADSADLRTVVGRTDDLAAAMTLHERIIAEIGPIDGVVASLGGWWEGQLLTEIEIGQWRRILDDNLTSHFIMARAFLGELAGRPGSVYVTLGGIAAVKPVPGSGPISVTGAAQAMLMRVLAEELKGTEVRLHEVDILTPIVTRLWQPGRPLQPGWLGGEEVGEYVARVVHPSFDHPDQLFLAIPPEAVPDPPAGSAGTARPREG